MGKPRDDKDTAQDLARDLAEIATHIGQLKGEAYAYLTSSSYDRLKLGLECALSAVEAATIEARRRMRLNEERKRRGRVPGRGELSEGNI